MDVAKSGPQDHDTFLLQSMTHMGAEVNITGTIKGHGLLIREYIKQRSNFR